MSNNGHNTAPYLEGDPRDMFDAWHEEMLRRRGLWDRIDEVVWAIEGDNESEGNQLSRRHAVKIAPFFIVREDGGERIFKSGLRLVRECLSGSAIPAAAASEMDEADRLAGQLSGEQPATILQTVIERFGDRCALAFSGAEEVVLIDMAIRNGLSLRVFTLDTGRLHSETYAFIDQIRADYGIAIDVFMPDSEALTDFVYRKGINSFFRDGHEACCQIRKVAPLRRALTGYDAWITGQRRDQSPATRADLPTIQRDPIFRNESGPLIKVNPLAGWTSDDVRAYIEKHDVPYNPLHDQGFASIGCQPCTRPTGGVYGERETRWWWEKAKPVRSVHESGDGI